MLAAIRARVGPTTPLYAVGVSLGGSALLNWLGRAGASAGRDARRRGGRVGAARPHGRGHRDRPGLQPHLRAALPATLKPKSARDGASAFPGLLDPRRSRAACARCRTFDDSVTAPLHGFAGTDDYWRAPRRKPWLAASRVPTLVLNARNDPFVPAASLPGARGGERAPCCSSSRRTAATPASCAAVSRAASSGCRAGCYTSSRRADERAGASHARDVRDLPPDASARPIPCFDRPCR